MKQTNGLNVAVLGLGRMGWLHAAAYAKMPLVCLKALCDTDEGRMAEFNRKTGANAACYSDFNQLLEDESIDAVSICLPDDMHLAPVLKALEAGKHILCEKPLSNTLAEAQTICERQKQSDKVFMVGYSLRFSPRHVQVKNRYDRGELGEAIMIYNRRSSPIVGPRHYAGHSDLADHVMIHDIDYMNWLLGAKPKTVYAKGRSLMLREAGMTDVIYALLTYPCGTMVCLESCWVLPELTPPALDDAFELIGTKGAAYMSCGDLGSAYVLNDRAAQPKPVYCGTPFLTEEVSDGYYEELTFFLNCVLSGQPTGMSCEEAVDDLEVVEAIKRSVAEGIEITLS